MKTPDVYKRQGMSTLEIDKLVYEYTNQLDTLKEEWEKSLKENRETVDDEQIAAVVSMMSGVPVQRMAQAEGMKLLGMKDDLLSKVIGQDKA